MEFFRGHAELDPGRALRVSRYLDERHVRLSVWDGDRATAAISLDEEEAERLRRFLDPAPAPSAFDDLVRSARGLLRR